MKTKGVKRTPQEWIEIARKRGGFRPVPPRRRTADGVHVRAAAGGGTFTQGEKTAGERARRKRRRRGMSTPKKTSEQASLFDSICEGGRLRLEQFRKMAIYESSNGRRHEQLEATSHEELEPASQDELAGAVGASGVGIGKPDAGGTAVHAAGARRAGAEGAKRIIVSQPKTAGRAWLGRQRRQR
jgi:hypothetical protein